MSSSAPRTACVVSLTVAAASGSLSHCHEPSIRAAVVVTEPRSRWNVAHVQGPSRRLGRRSDTVNAGGGRWLLGGGASAGPEESGRPCPLRPLHELRQQLV